MPGFSAFVYVNYLGPIYGKDVARIYDKYQSESHLTKWAGYSPIRSEHCIQMLTKERVIYFDNIPLRKLMDELAIDIDERFRIVIVNIDERKGYLWTCKMNARRADDMINTADEIIELGRNDPAAASQSAVSYKRFDRELSQESLERMGLL